MEKFQSDQPFEPYLVSGEHVVWWGQPKQGLMLSAADIFLIPFSLLWGGFAIFWNAMVWLAPLQNEGAGPDFFFKIFGLPFLFIGLYLIAGRFFHDAYIRKRLLYAITNQRILVLNKSKLTSFDIRRLPRLELSEKRDGTGTLAFEASIMPWGSMNGFGWWLPAADGSAKFMQIQDPRKVYELIRSLSQA